MSLLLIACLVVLVAEAIVMSRKVHYTSPQDKADELNRNSVTRGCNKCGSTKFRYDVNMDSLVCLNCGAADDRKWVLEHPEMSK